MNRRTLLKGGAVAVALAALGLGGFVHLQRQQNRTMSDTITGQWDLVPAGLWLLPGLRDARMVVPDRPHSHDEAMDEVLKAQIKRVRSFRVNTNDWRARGLRPIDRKAPGVFRIAAIGDSVTFGWGVEDEEAWPVLVEQRLRERGVDAEVLNFGVPAQQIAAMTVFLQNAGPSLELDGVVLAERIEAGQTAQSYARLVRNAMFALPQAKLMVALPPISRFDPFGRSIREQEHADLRRAFDRRTTVIDLTDHLWAAQTETGVDLEIDGVDYTMLRRDTGEVLYEWGHQGRTLPSEVYALFDNDESIKEPLFFDAGHPDAEGFHPFADGVVEGMDTWFS